MVLELVAGRLVAPYFGQSTCTWAALTGVTLAGVSIGNALGGWLSAKCRRPRVVASAALVVGGVFCALLPGVLPAVDGAVRNLGGFEVRTAAFVALAWLPPMLALGCVTPAIAAACVRAERNGRDLGVLYCASMVGSAVGSLLGGLVLPFVWPADWLYMAFGAVLALAAIGAWASRRCGFQPRHEAGASRRCGFQPRHEAGAGNGRIDDWLGGGAGEVARQNAAPPCSRQACPPGETAETTGTAGTTGTTGTTGTNGTTETNSQFSILNSQFSLPSPLLLLAVFILGWFGMGVELAGAKLVTPILGGSHVVWSLIFITFIGTMGIGGWLGGIIADKWPRIETALVSLVGLAAVACATVWAEARILPGLLAEQGALVRLFGFTVAAFSPLGVALGAASTVLLKFSTAEALGRGDRSVVGFMYATASAGSVCGTFITGFALVGRIGSGALCVLLASALVVVALLLARRFRVWGLGGDGPFRACLAGVVLFAWAACAFWFRAPQLPLEVSGDDGWRVLSAAESRYNVVTVSAIAGRENVRTIWLDRIPHTTVDTKRRDHLSTSYTRMIDEVVRGMVGGVESPALFMIGGGGYALPRKWTVGDVGWRRLVVAEIDAAVTDAAVRFLDASPVVTNGVWYAEGDGRRVLDDLLAEGEGGRFDVVVGDTISDAAIPYHLATAEFDARIKLLLKPGGAYVMHLLDRLDEPGLLASMLKTLSATWRHVGAVAYQQVGDVRQSFVLVASDDPSCVDMERHAAAVAKAYPDSWPLAIGGERARELAGGAGAMLLTDRFAPMEKFVWSVVFDASDKRVERDSEVAKALAREGRCDEALEAVKRALAERPEFPAAVEALRAVLQERPEDEAAFGLLRGQALRRSAGFVAQAAYASVLAQRGDFAGAERELALLRRRFPERRDFAVGWALNAAKCGKRAEAQAWLAENGGLFGELEREALARRIAGEVD